jgi:hypothetical protein
MQRKTMRALVGTLALAATTGFLASPAFGDSPPGTSTAVSASNANGRGLQAHGLTDDGQLVRFNTNRPERAKVVGWISGLQGDNYLVGIDERVQDGNLYGVGDQGGVYTLSKFDATATKVSQLTVALTGKNFAVDFNPDADRLRIVGNDGQNLSHNVNAGGTTAVQTPLSIPTPPPAVPPVPSVTAVAYTNNDLDTNTGTTLFDIDTNTDQVFIQAPPGNGLLTRTGKLGRDVSGDVGFDIYSRVSNGVVTGNRGFAVFQSGRRSQLANVSLLTGRADDAGRFPRGVYVVDLALALGQS